MNRNLYFLGILLRILSKLGYFIIKAHIIYHNWYNNDKLFEDRWKISDTLTRYPFFEFSIFTFQKHLRGYYLLKSGYFIIKICDLWSIFDHSLYNNVTINGSKVDEKNVIKYSNKIFFFGILNQNLYFLERFSRILLVKIRTPHYRDTISASYRWKILNTLRYPFSPILNRNLYYSKTLSRILKIRTLSRS